MSKILQSRTHKLFPLYTVIFLGFFGYALTIALFIPMLMDKSFGILPAASSTSLRVTVSGFLLAMYPLGQFLGSPIIGKLSDHYGRKKVLILSLIACLLGLIGITLSIHLQLLIPLFISCFITGLCESNMAIAQSVLVEHATDAAHKTKLIGYAYSAASVGYVVGPLVGGLGASTYGYSFPFLLTAVGVLFLLVWVILGFKDNYKPHTDTKIKVIEAITAIGTIVSDKKLRKIYFINFLIFFAIQGLYRVAPIYVMDEWSPTLKTFTTLIAFVSLLCLIANLFIMGPLAKKFSTKDLLSGLLIFSGIFVITIIIPKHFNWIWLSYGLAVIPTVMALTASTTWISSQASQQEQGQVLGNNQALLVLGEASSAAIGGLIAAIKVSLPVAIMGAILLMCFFLVRRSK